jgi:hypothetical protein
MVMVEVEVPGLRKTYDFRLNDEAKIDDVIEEICSIICQKEKGDVLLRTRDMMLSAISNGIIMNNMYTLGDYNILDGMKLMLI